MEPIGINQPVIIPAATVSAPAKQSTPEVAKPAPAATVLSEQINYSAQAAEQKRAQTVQQTSQQISNAYVLGDQSFTIFKDSTGQYITRFTSLRDGKVTYIPEPSLYKMGGSSGADATPIVKIQA